MAKKKKKTYKSVLKVLHKKLKPHYPVLVPIVLALAVFQFSVLTANNLYAKTPVMGLRFDGKTVGLPLLAQSNQELYKKEAAIAGGKPLQVMSPDFKEKVTAADTGMLFDPTKISEEVNEYGRTEKWPLNVIHQDMAALGITNLFIKPTGVDKEKQKNFIASLDGKIAKKPQDASYSYSSGKVEVLADKSGFTVDDQALGSQLIDLALSERAMIQVPLQKTAPSITQADLGANIGQVENAVSTPLQLVAQGQNITITPDQLIKFVVVQKDQKSNSISVSFDSGQIAQAVSGIAKKVDVAASPVVSDGEDTLDQGRPGQKIDQNAAKILADDLSRRKSDPSFAKSNPKISFAVNPVAPGFVLRKPKIIHITMDDIPNSSTAQILDILKERNVHITFFVIGASAEQNPDLLRRVVAEGHAIGNHSYSHPNLTTLSLDGVKDELQKCQDAVEKITGIHMTMWRPPYSAHNAAIDGVAQGLGLRLVMYNDNPNDSTSNPGPHVIAQRVFAEAKPGGTVIIHSEAQTAAALPEIITGLRSRGFKIKP